MSAHLSKARKKPQFLHLHPTQAAKAKQAWVNKVKLRSQWAKERRKVQVQSSDGYQDQHEMEVDNGNGDEEKREQNLDGSEEVTMEEPAAGPSRKRKRSSRSDDRVSNTKEVKPTVQPLEKEQRERLRNLSRKAYAPESLHTFKSDPLHRRRGETHSRGAAGGQPMRGRGQPNMKLRMNALLEKIKLDAGVA